jgi:hypothetical protein
MPKRRKWMFAVLAGSLVLGAIWFALSDRQPSYLGRPLAFWLSLRNKDDDESVWYQPYAEGAIRQMGTNCLPHLLKWIAYEPPAWKTKLISILSKPRWIPDRFQEDRTDRLAEGAADAFRTLGRRAAPAIPQLARLAKDPSRRMSANRAAFVLISFGPETQAIVMDLLNDPRPLIRTPAIFEVARFGTNALPAIPRLIDCLKDPDENIAAMAVSALGDLHLWPELSVTALTNALQDGRERVEREAVTALDKFGADGRAIVMELLNDPRPSIRISAILEIARFGTNALPAIPRLIDLLKDPDKSVAAMAARSLGELQLRPELSVPALTNALQNGSFEIAPAAHTALGKFGLVFPAVRVPQNVMGLYGLAPRVTPGFPTNARPVRAH